MQTGAPVYSSLQELVVSDRIYRERSIKMLSLILKLEKTPSFGSPSVFMINRPRGFGLSLLANAIDRIMKRDPETINKIEDQGLLNELPERCTLFFDFKHFKATDLKEFTQSLIDTVQELFWIHHIESHTDQYITPKVFFSKLIDELYKRHQNQIVIVIDNYDLPLMYASLMDDDKCQEASSVYLDMLNVIRADSQKVRWVLLSGHLKFALTSEYSEGLPLVEDLSYDPSYETLFGFTAKEVNELFADKIEKFSKSFNITEDEYLKSLEKCYGGFAFSDNLVKVMCPACISHVMSNSGKLLPYSATGSYLFLKHCLNRDLGNLDLDWLYGKDGQDPLFSGSISGNVTGKQIGTLLIQSGFATRSRVLVNGDEGYSTWRYRFDCPNLDMQKTFDIINGRCPESDHTVELLSFDQSPKQTSS
ncbi:MAG: AAA family ATPase [Succinivibrio sp.]